MTLHAPALSTPGEHPARTARARLLASRAVVVAAVVVGAVALPAPAGAATTTVRASGPAAWTGATAPDVDRARLAARASRSSARTRLAARGATAAVPAGVVTERLPLAFRTLRREDTARERGTETVVVPGREGLLERTYVDLGAAGRTLLREERVREPQDRVVAVGTRARPSYGGLDWDALAQCESGGDPRAMSGSGRFRGLYQFSLPTWRSVGGTGDPVDHSVDSQTARAYELFQRDGRAPWPECGRHL